MIMRKLLFLLPLIIPSSAHGTNPASAVMAGFEVVVTGCDENGNIDINELRQVASDLKDSLAGLMEIGRAHV